MVIKNNKGFTLIEVLVGMGLFLVFALAVYGAMGLVSRVTYQSRLRIEETEILSQQLEVARNLPYDSVGIIGGVPAGLLARTSTIARNGIIFNVTTTVRDIDDAFDGTVGGSPSDSSPADYKLVVMSINCPARNQTKWVTLSTMVAPKQLEGASQNGALFMQVFDANGLAVPGASVHIVNSAVSPNITIDDITCNDGWLRLVDTPTGTMAYNITVTKSGYSTDRTIAPSVANPNPAKKPSNVVSQNVTEISFSIDQLGSFNVHSVGPTCSALGSIGFTVTGDKLIGIDPDIAKYSSTFTTDANGDKSFPDMEWDKYNFAISGSVYDIAGAIPMFPLNLTPGLNQEVYIILRAHSANNLLVAVKDAGSGLPIANATVNLTDGGSYNQTVYTGTGYTRQTDWSGGSGQAVFTNETKYYSDDGKLNVSTAGDIKLKKSGQYYLPSGYLDSSTFDAGAGVDWQNLNFITAGQTGSCGANPVKFQIATSNSSSPATWNFVGPDGTDATYYSATSSIIWSGHDGQRYLRYRAMLETLNTSYTPTLSEVVFTFTNGCTPPGQAFFSALSATTYTLTVSKDGYSSHVGNVNVSGDSQAEINLSI